MFSLVRNNREVANGLTELTHHAHVDERRRELCYDPVELASFDAVLEHRHMFLMSALVRQRDQRISPLYIAGLSLIVLRKGLDRFVWDLLVDQRVVLSRRKAESIVDLVAARLPLNPAFTSLSETIGLCVLDNKAYFIKETHEHVDQTSDKGGFLYTNNIMTLPVLIQLNVPAR